jgi:outer membrane biosynthesis protein TonB
MAGLIVIAGATASGVRAQEAARADSPEAVAQRACGESSKLVYRPPLDLVQLAAKRLRGEGKTYQREVKIVTTVGEDGLVRDVQMARSSGHRLLDVAIRNWATGQMFAPQECSPADRYLIMLTVEVAGGS